MHSATLSNVLFLILCCNKVYVSNGDAEARWSMRKVNLPLRLLIFETLPVSGQQTPSTSMYARTHPHSVSQCDIFSVVLLKYYSHSDILEIKSLQLWLNQIHSAGTSSQCRGFTPITRGINKNLSCVFQVMGTIKVVHGTSLHHTSHSLLSHSH